ncbi:MAG TPA: nucleotidyltransferase family protein [Firmicutes bacterium]|nr:nucleotidyltransferase family protein [Bacillota bacterium]
MKAVIPAAGKGTRLAGLTLERPKAMVPVHDKPCLEHIINALSQAGIKEIIIITGHLSECIESYFKDGSAWGVQITYVRQDMEGKYGTGYAVHLTADLVGDSPFLMTYGDVLVPFENYSGIVERYRERPVDALIGVNWVEDPYKGAAVYVDEEGKVVKIIEKPPKGTAGTHWNNAGVIIFSPVVFEYTAQLTPSERGEYELTEAIQRMHGDRREIHAYFLQGYWRDIGTPADLQAAGEMLRQKHK